MLFSVDVVRLVVLLVTLLSWWDFTNLAYHFMACTCSLCLSTNNINSWNIWNTSSGESGHDDPKAPFQPCQSRAQHHCTAGFYNTKVNLGQPGIWGYCLMTKLNFTAHISMVIWSCFIASALVLQYWPWNSLLPEHTLSHPL